MKHNTYDKASLKMQKQVYYQEALLLAARKDMNALIVEKACLEMSQNPEKAKLLQEIDITMQELNENICNIENKVMDLKRDLVRYVKEIDKKSFIGSMRFEK